MEPLNAVTDLSDHNGNVNLQMAKDAGNLGVIQKATQGAKYVQTKGWPGLYSGHCIT